MATVSQVTEAVFRSRFDDQMSAAAAAAAKSIKDLGTAVVTTDEAVTRGQKSANALVNSFDPVTKATRGLEKAQRDLAAAQKTLSAEVATGGKTQEQADRALKTLGERVQKARADLDAVRRANADASGAIVGLGNAAKLTTREMQQLSPQIADIGVSLAGGMNPLLVLVQQGPQIVDAVGGIGRAFALLRAAITPTVAAIAAFTVATVGSIAVAESQDRALASLSNRLRTTRGDYEALAISIERSARAAAAAGPVSTGDARDAGRIIAGQRNYGGTAADLQAQILLAQRLSVVMGTDVPNAAERLAQAIAKPTEAARRMADEGLRTMNEGLLRSIQRMEQQGNVAEAGRLTIEAYDRALGQLAKTPLQAATEELSQAFTKLWQAVRPIVDAVGGVLGRALAGLVKDMAELVGYMASLVNFLSDNRVTRFLFGEGAPAAAAAAPQISATESAMQLVRQINPRTRQQQDLQDSMLRLRRGLASPDTDPQQAADMRSALASLQQQYQALAGPVGEHLRQLQQQLQLSQYAAGAARELAQAEQAVHEAARGAGQGQADANAVAAARALVQARLNEELGHTLDAADRDIEAQRGLAAAYQSTAGAISRTEAMVRAQNEAFRYGAPFTDEYAEAVRKLYEKYLELAQAQQAVNDSRAIREQEQQLALIQRETELVGATVDERERELAALRERQRILADPAGDPNSEAGQRRIANARAIAEATQELRRQQSAYDELASAGRRAFEQVGDAIVDAFARGEQRTLRFGDLVRGVAASLAQTFLRLSIVNPLSNWAFGTNLGTLGGAVGGGSTGGGMLSSLSSLFSLGGGINSLTGGGLLNSLGLGGFSLSGSLTGLGAATGLFGNGVPVLMGANGMLAGGGAASSGIASSAGLLGGTSLGSLLGPAALGAMGGGLLAQFTGGNPIGGSIGGGLGAAAGFLIGGPVGALIGGAAGGGLGGLFGNSGRGFSGGDALIGRDNAGGLVFSGFAGKGFDGSELTQQAQQEIAAFNARLAAAGVFVNSGMRASIGGGESSAPRTLAGALDRYGFGLGSNDPRIAQAMAPFAGNIEGALAIAEEAKAVIAALDGLKNPTDSFAASMKALDDQFRPLWESTVKLGFGFEEVNVAWTKAQQDLTAQRDRSMLGITEGLRIRRLRADGLDGEASLAEFDFRAVDELKGLEAQLKALGMEASFSAGILENLRDVQARERAELALGGNTLRSLGQDINEYLERLRTTQAGSYSIPEQLAAARTIFDRSLAAARLNDPEALGRITGDADALLGAARGMYASGQGFTAIRDYVTTTLAELEAARVARAANTPQPATGEDIAGLLAGYREENVQLRAEVRQVQALLADIAATNRTMLNREAPTPVGARG